MKPPHPKTLASALGVVVVAATAFVWTGTGQAQAADAERKIIVTLAGAAPITKSPAAITSARKSADGQQNDLLANAKKQGLHAKATRKLNLMLNAVAMTVPASEVDKIAKLPGVKAVYPDKPMKAQTEVSVPLINAPKVWNGTPPSTGKGVTVAVIDTGVDYTHPDLGGGIGPNNKVIGGYDFVNDDADPMDDNGHGTHVAGIIAAKAASENGITGVAPDASIVAYKVLDASGTGDSSDIIAGIEAAADPTNPLRADVINLSLGSPGDGTDPVAMAATNAVNAGVVVVASAGNDGPYRDTVQTIAAADGVIAVGASISNLRIPVAHLAGGELIQTFPGAISANPTGSVTAELVNVGFGTPDEFAAAGDITGKIVLLNGFVAESPQDIFPWDVDIARMAEDRGAIALIGGQAAGGGPVFALGKEDNGIPLTANLTANASGDDGSMDKLVVMGVDDTQYNQLNNLTMQGTVKVTLGSSDVTDRMASFSSRGPSARFEAKPDLVAPGYNINSTAPTAIVPTGQQRLSGTSMASPHVAGAAALLLQLHPNSTPAQVKSQLTNSAKPLSEDVTTAGAGRLDVQKAAQQTVTAAPSSISFGLADLSKVTVGGAKTVTLTNTATVAQTITLTPDTKQITLSTKQVTIPAGGSKTVTVTLTAAKPTDWAEVAGKITASTKDQRLTIPYLLVVRAMIVQASPDASDGRTSIFMAAPTTLAKAPTVTVTGHGTTRTYTPAPLGSTSYKIDVVIPDPGIYHVVVRAVAATGQKLNGTSAFEVTPVDSRKDRWESVGPNSAGGHLYVAPSDSNVAVMLQPAKAAPWLTTDGGKTWTQRGRLPIASVDGFSELVIDATNANRWWYTANDPALGRATILRTEDAGRTWEPVAEPGAYIDHLTADTQTRTLVASTGGQLLVSRDGGDSWTATATGMDDAAAKLNFSGDDLYLATTDSVWKIPGMATANPGPTTEVYNGTKFIWDFTAGDGVVAMLQFTVGVVTSTDGGANWNTVKPIGFGATNLIADGSDLFLGTISGQDAISPDHGQTWNPITLPSRDAATYDFDKWNGALAITNTAGVYRGDGTTWGRLGVAGLTAYDLTISNGNLIAGTDSGTYRTALPTTTPDWGKAEGEGFVGTSVKFLQTDPNNTNVVWRIQASTFGDFAVQRSEGGGQNWLDITYGNEVPTALFIDPANSNHVLVGFARLGKQGLMSTTDGGITWKNLFHDQPIRAITKVGSTLWLGTTDGLYKSTDGGVTKTKVLSGPVTSILSIPGKLFIGGTQIRYSADGGKTFKAGDAGDLPMFITEMVYANGKLYAATDAAYFDGLAKTGRGVLRSPDGGLHWNSISNGLDNRDVTAIVVTPDKKWLYIGTRDGGVQRLQL